MELEIRYVKNNTTCFGGYLYLYKFESRWEGCSTIAVYDEFTAAGAVLVLMLSRIRSTKYNNLEKKREKKKKRETKWKAVYVVTLVCFPFIELGLEARDNTG